MQLRRRGELPPALDHNNRPVEVPAEYWDDLQHMDLQRLCNLTLAMPLDNRRLVFRFLREDIRVRYLGSCETGVNGPAPWTGAANDGNNWHRHWRDRDRVTASLTLERG